jgi:hypothetical protein
MMERAAYVHMLKNGAYQIKVPLIGHTIPHVLSYEFYSREAAETWMESPKGRDLIKQVREKFSPYSSTSSK